MNLQTTLIVFLCFCATTVLRAERVDMLKAGAKANGKTLNTKLINSTIDRLNRGDGYSFGDYPKLTDSYKEGDLGTPNATWEKAKKFDVGLDMNFLNKFSFTIDYFLDKRYDQLVTREYIPLVIGIGFSPNNIARTTNQGFDGQISYQDRFGDFDFNTNLVFSYAKNRVDYKAEQLGIADKINVKAGKLSFGQQQRVAFIRALCQPFDFLFLDEPISHLDDDNSRIMGELIIAEAKAQGAGVIATSIGKHIELPYNHTLQL